MWKIGPNLVFGRLREGTGIQTVLGELLRGRQFEFPVDYAAKGG